MIGLGVVGVAYSHKTNYKRVKFQFGFKVN